MSHICPTCQYQFTRSYDLRRHIEAIHNRVKAPAKIHECTLCHKIFSSKSNLNRHRRAFHNDPSQTSTFSTTLPNVPNVPNTPDVPNAPNAPDVPNAPVAEKIAEYVIERINQSLIDRNEAFKKEVDARVDARVTDLKQEIQQIKPSNNVLQVVCIGSNDNYLQMLTEKMGDIVPAIEYIKQCALSDINGDSLLLEKVYQVTLRNP